MARVLGLLPDLLFGSRVQSALEAAGHEVELVPDAARLRERLERAGAGSVLIVDLTDDELEGARALEELAAEVSLEHVRTLGFYSHVDVRARERAERAGFELLVPRSRMAREAAQVVALVSRGR
jgi:DNA-binding NarL/FixJ family response regulator